MWIVVFDEQGWKYGTCVHVCKQEINFREMLHWKKNTFRFISVIRTLSNIEDGALCENS